MKEKGSASVFMSLENGIIKVEHGTDKTVLYKWTANKGDWERIFNTFKRLINESVSSGNA